MEMRINPGAAVAGGLLEALVQVLKEYLVLLVDLFDADGKAVFPGKEIHGFSLRFNEVITRRSGVKDFPHFMQQ
jgi:hypothetical protein